MHLKYGELQSDPFFDFSDFNIFLTLILQVWERLPGRPQGLRQDFGDRLLRPVFVP